jgi:hypothetical protein
VPFLWLSKKPATDLPSNRRHNHRRNRRRNHRHNCHNGAVTRAIVAAITSAVSRAITAAVTATVATTIPAAIDTARRRRRRSIHLAALRRSIDLAAYQQTRQTRHQLGFPDRHLAISRDMVNPRTVGPRGSTSASGQGRPWPAGRWHGRSTPSSGNTRAFRHLRFVPIPDGLGAVGQD